jgi:hypothetical protein
MGAMFSGGPKSIPATPSPPTMPQGSSTSPTKMSQEQMLQMQRAAALQGGTVMGSTQGGGKATTSKTLLGQ